MCLLYAIDCFFLMFFLVFYSNSYIAILLFFRYESFARCFEAVDFGKKSHH